MNPWNRSISFIHLKIPSKSVSVKSGPRWPMDSLQKIRFGFERSQCPNAKFEAMAVSHPLLFTISSAGHCLGEVLWSHIAVFSEAFARRDYNLLVWYVYPATIIWVTGLTQNIKIEIIQQPRSKRGTKCLQPPTELACSTGTNMVPTVNIWSKNGSFQDADDGFDASFPCMGRRCFCVGSWNVQHGLSRVCCKMVKCFSRKVRIRFEVVIKVQAHPKCNLLFHNASLMFSGFFIKACWPTMFIWLRSTKVKWWNDEILNPLQPLSAVARASVWRRRQRRRLERRCLGMAAMCLGYL